MISKLQSLLNEKKLPEFFESVHSELTADPDVTVNDILSVESKVSFKLRLLQYMMDMYEKNEQYEKCVPLRDIIKSVNDRRLINIIKTY